LQVLEDLDAEVEISSACETIRDYIKISVSVILTYYELKEDKQWFDEWSSELSEHKKQPKSQWLKVPSEKNWDKLKNIKMLRQQTNSGIKTSLSEMQN
jgi:hypothetical protein